MLYFLIFRKDGINSFLSPSAGTQGKPTVDCLSEGGVKHSMKPNQNVVPEG